MAMLAIDYGDNQAYSNSLTGIASHKILQESDWIQRPGEVDLSAYVNFRGLANVASEYKEVNTIGPFPQGAFLECMGIGARADILCRSKDIKLMERIKGEYERLVSPEHMGETYKVLYVGNKEIGEVYPFLADMQFTKS